MNPLPSYLEGRAHTESWYDDEEVARVIELPMAARWDTLLALIRHHGYTHICEVGVDEGLNAAHILEACWQQIDEMVLVDKSKFEVFDRQVQRELWPAVYIECLSVTAAAMYPDGYFDLVFIDAWHDYKDVREDIDAWLPKVSVGGILAGHDWNLPDTGVREAVLETLALDPIYIAEDPASAGKKWVWWAEVKE